jgi:hypothetical protein
VVNKVVTSRQNNNNRTSGLEYSPQSIGSTEVNMNKFTIHWFNGKVSSFMGGEPVEGNKAFHIDSEGCKILVPYAWYKDGEVEALKKSS